MHFLAAKSTDPAPPESADTPWYFRRWFQTSCMGIIALVTVVEGGYAIFKRENDFNCHIVFGQHFLAGDPYSSAGNYYPLGRLMFNSLLTVGNYYVTRTVCYLLAIAGLAVIFYLWGKMAEVWFPSDRPKRRTAMIVSLAVLMPLVIRDLDECGLQILLVLMLTLAAYAMFTGRKLQTGFWLATAITYKATPLLFLPLLLWKREWRAAGSLVVCLICLNLLPATYLGWDTMVASNQYWLENSGSIMRDTPDAYPSVPHGVEAPKIQNASLKAGIARLLETYPPGHSLHLEHPLFFQFGNLPVKQAKRVVNGLILLLGIGIAWAMRRRWSGVDGRRRLVNEWAVACIFAALMSPLCWKQHLVVLIPAVYLLCRWIQSDTSISRRHWLLIGSCAGVYFLAHRALLGEELSMLVQSYHLLTFASLGVVWLVLRLPAEPLSAAVTDFTTHSPALESPSPLPLRRVA